MEKLISLKTQSPDLFGESLPIITLASRRWPPDYIEQFWDAYPRKIAKAHAVKTLDKIRENGVDFGAILAGIARYVAWLGQRNAQNWRPEPKHPATWLNGGCWDDEFKMDVAKPKNSFFQEAMGVIGGRK